MNEAVSKKIESFFTKFKHQVYKKGEILVRADEDPSGIFYLKDGIVREYAISKNGDEIVVNIFKPYSFFPMSWAINNTKNRYFFEAVTPVEVWKASKEKAVEFIKQEPEVLYNLLSRVYSGTDGLLTRMSYLMSGNAYTRLIAELLIHAKRFGIKEKDASVRLTLSERELATQSGMTRETISREIKILKNKNLVTFTKNTLIINNLSRFEEELLKFN